MTKINDTVVESQLIGLWKTLKLSETSLPKVKKIIPQRRYIVFSGQIYICIFSKLKQKLSCLNLRKLNDEPPHTAGETRVFLRQHFRNQLNSLCEEVVWPLYSADLTPSDFLWWYLKDRIYLNHKPHRREINDIPWKKFPEVMRNMTGGTLSVITQVLIAVKPKD